MKVKQFFLIAVALLLIAVVAAPVVSAAPGDVSPTYVDGKFTWVKQDDTYYCVEAVAKMITQYYHDKNAGAVPTVWEQEAIMNKIEKNIPRNEVDKYYSQPNNAVGLGKTSSDYNNCPPDWDGVVTAEISGNRPFKIGIHYPTGEYHAMAVTGYKISGGVKYLYVYDPNPGKPNPYWLNYDTTTITNYVIIK